MCVCVCVSLSVSMCVCVYAHAVADRRQHMIYCPHVLIKLFQQSDSEEREKESVGKEQCLQIRHQIDKSRKQEWIQRWIGWQLYLKRRKSSGDLAEAKEKLSEGIWWLMSWLGALIHFHLQLSVWLEIHLKIYHNPVFILQHFLPFFPLCVCACTASWTTTTSAALKMELSERYVTWKCCEYLFIQSLCYQQ